jgi:hypothetical protein
MVEPISVAGADASMTHGTHKLRILIMWVPLHFFLILPFLPSNLMAQSQPATTSSAEPTDAACRLLTRPELAAIVGQPKTITPTPLGSGDNISCSLEFVDRPRIFFLKYPKHGATVDPYDGRTVEAFHRINETEPFLNCQTVAANAEWCVRGPAIPSLSNPDDGTIHVFSHDIHDNHAIEVFYINFSRLNDAAAVATYKAEAIKLATAVSKEFDLQPAQQPGK